MYGQHQGRLIGRVMKVQKRKGRPKHRWMDSEREDSYREKSDGDGLKE